MSSDSTSPLLCATCNQQAALATSLYCANCRDKQASQAHYHLTLPDGNKAEALDIMHALGHFNGYCYGAALAYLLRAPRKGTESEDLRKARFFINELLGESERNNGVSNNA